MYSGSIQNTPSHQANPSGRVNGGICPDHEEIITNFCLNPECIRPLCPVCLEKHSKEHIELKTIPDIQSIMTISRKCLQKTKVAIDELNQEIEKNQIQYILNPKGLIDENSKILASSKERVMRMVDNYYEEMDEMFRRKVLENSIKAGDLTHAFDKIRKAIEELNYLNTEISKPAEENYFKLLETVCRLDVRKMKKTMIKDIHKITDFRQMDTVKLKFEEHNFSKIQNAMERYCRIEIEGDNITAARDKLTGGTNKGGHVRNASSSNRDFNNNRENSMFSFTPIVRNPGDKFRERKAESPFRDENENFSVDRAQVPYKVIRQRQVLHISQGNYFAPEASGLTVKDVGKGPFLHFFQNNDSYLHLLPLKNIQEGKFKVVPLRGNISIPPFHKSIMSPAGRLFLIGGSLKLARPETDSSKLHESKKSNQICEFNYGSLTLDLIGNMKHARSSHSVCFLDPYIIIVGGITNNNVHLKECEKFNTETNKFENIASCAVASICSSVCAFQGRYVYKIGGIGEDQNLSYSIERYDSFNNSWNTVDPLFNKSQHQQVFQPLSTSASLQINDTEIFVFGGYYGDDRSSRQSWVLRVDKFDGQKENHSIVKAFEYDLPFEEGFWNSTPIIEGRKIFALQNYEDPRTKNCVESQRRILVFNSMEWEAYN